jgi:RNA polymerase sigma-70 factor (ECF subfamily)
MTQPRPESDTRHVIAPPSSERPIALLGDDAALAARIRTGDSDAFEAMYLAYYSPLCRFTVTLVRTPEVAEELVQDLLCRIWEQRAAWSPGSVTIAAYLFRAARNRALNYLKHERIGREFADARARAEDPPGFGRGAPAPDVCAAEADFAAALERALEGLPPRCREACALRWQHGLTYAEVAAAMGITLKAAEALISRGLKALRVALGAFAERA